MPESIAIPSSCHESSVRLVGRVQELLVPPSWEHYAAEAVGCLDRRQRQPWPFYRPCLQKRVQLLSIYTNAQLRKQETK